VKSATHPSQVIARNGTAEAVCYDILGILGEGGSGVTYRAIDPRTQQPVALKALSLHQMNDWKAIELFEREAKVLSTLDRDGIPKYLDYFTTDLDGDRYFYIVQSLAPGKTLSEWMHSGWRVTEAELKPIIIQILEILIYLHRHYPPIVHRDLKPSNILKTEDGKIYLVDFGAVQQTYHDTFMRGSTVVGTYGYMAPEQFRGQAVPATDLYGLGATILHLLTHRSPAEIPQDGLRLNFRDRLQVSSSFADWLERMLEPDVGSRFSSSTKALEVLKNPPKSKKFKPTFSKFDRASIGAIGLASLVLVFGVFDRSKYYWLSMAGLVSNEPFAAMSKQPSPGQIQAYLDRGFNIDTKDRNDRTLMSHAIDNDLPEVVQMLIERGADLRDSANLVPPQQKKLKSIQDQKKNFDRDVVQEAAGSNNLSFVAHLKEQHQSEIDRQEKEVTDSNLNSIIYYAVRRNKISVLELLLKRGVSLDRAYPDRNKLSLLHLASVHQDGEIVKLLLERGIDPNIKDALGCTPLHTAIARDFVPYYPKLSSHFNKISLSDNNSISRRAIGYLVNAGAKSNLQCNLNNDNGGFDRGDRIDSIFRLKRSRNFNLMSAYDNNYSSPSELLLLFGITDVNLNTPAQLK
jgi:serine/threonine protein kinase